MHTPPTGRSLQARLSLSWARQQRGARLALARLSWTAAVDTGEGHEVPPVPQAWLLPCFVLTVGLVLGMRWPSLHLSRHLPSL